MMAKAAEPARVLATSALDEAGAGLAIEDELCVHVAGALPGETVRARVVHISPHRRGQRRDAWAELESVTVASPDRVAPVCPAFGPCGGCVVQHLALPAQLAWKRGLVAAALADLPGLPAIDACVPSPASFGYRNQSKYVVGRDDTGALVLGAYAPRSHRIVDLAGCRLGEPPHDAIAAELRVRLGAAGITAFDERTRTGLLRYVVIRSNAAGEALVVLVTARPPPPALAALGAELRAAVPAVTGVVVNVNATPGNVILGREEHPVAGRATLREEIAGVPIEVGALGFLQLNRGVAAAAYAAIDAALVGFAPTGTNLLADVYGGVGAIALTLRDRARELVVIESNAAATAAGAAAVARAGIGNLRYVNDEAAAGLRSLAGADVIVLNPPRAGASAAAVAELLRLAPRLVLYLSCNPITLARDLATIVAGGYAVDRITPFDMLPHTAHVETLACVRRRD